MIDFARARARSLRESFLSRARVPGYSCFAESLEYLSNPEPRFEDAKLLFPKPREETEEEEGLYFKASRVTSVEL